MAKASYLEARDRTLLVDNTRALRKARCVLNDEFSDSEIEEDCKHLRVFLRFRNIPIGRHYTIKDNFLICHIPKIYPRSRILRCDDKISKQYEFTDIFGPHVTQEEIFHKSIKQQIIQFINGDNCSVLAYGTSGAGKTFTMIGTETDPGMLPRSLEYLFRTLPQQHDSKHRILFKPFCTNDSGSIVAEHEVQAEIDRCDYLLNLGNIDKQTCSHTYRLIQERISLDSADITEDYNTNFSVWISFAEIYNEMIYDLLASDRLNRRKTLKLGKTSSGTTYIKNLSSVYVGNGLQAYEIFQYGVATLNYAATAVNTHSSRSHSIFTIKLVQSYKDEVRISSYNFCDLAGSERSKKTGNVGIRQEESNNINTSLLVLGRCIEKIATSQRNSAKGKLSNNPIIPFRESKLTQILERALKGFERISIIVNVNPADNMLGENLHVLDFSTLAKEVLVDSIPDAKIKLKERLTQLFGEGNANYAQNGTIVALQARLNLLQTEHDELKDAYDALLTKLVETETAKETIEDSMRKELVADFSEQYNDYIRNMEKRLEERHQRSLQDTINFYESQIEQIKLQKDAIIISDSDDDDTNSDKCRIGSTMKKRRRMNDERMRNDDDELKAKDGFDPDSDAESVDETCDPIILRRKLQLAALELEKYKNKCGELDAELEEFRQWINGDQPDTNQIASVNLPVHKSSEKSPRGDEDKL